ncbi:transposase [Hymenobacter endophyticus]|uniref:Transposase n=1 Tax=Hymenobacter endophyticus TaxID=3076335 RepID=A0ABU3TE51_9BACT|nr:transposase [Hymenobacter endophyticus]MDU0369656.1 transposase [Hymenobacter endophyticus]
MTIQPEHLYHIYNRGNNQQRIFFTPEHYLFFLRKIRTHVVPHAQILAYCLMPNHFHFLVLSSPSPQEQHPLLPAFGTVLGSYAQAINQQRQRTGSLFQAKTKARLLSFDEADYPRTCFHYLHQNPVRAGLVRSLEEWPYSSYRDYAGYRNGSLCQQATARLYLDLPPTQSAFRAEAIGMIPAQYIHR